jgi:ATP-dependent DNA helicase RecQ
MLNFGFNELQNALSAWPQFDFKNYSSAKNSLLERILQILINSQIGILQKQDLQPLIRQLLLNESANTSQTQNLRVPDNRLWPTDLDWSSHGVSAMRIIKDGTFLLTALPWHPDWLGGGEFGVFSDSFSDKEVRMNGQCKADPFITDVTNYQNYSSPGQREAIRAAFLMPPGETLIVNLPTGSGKSLVGQTPSLVHYQEGNLTIFVVPTVALAIDQERQMNNYFHKSSTSNQIKPLAWYGGLTREVQVEIRKNIRNGSQRILFASPESLTTSLLRIIFEITRNGMLRYLVIDEAHLITQWGDEFRPAFQLLSGLRNSLLKVSNENGVESFRTLLLSATYTPETIDTLSNLFGPQEKVQIVTATHLRPEPQYWFSSTKSFVEKKVRVLEALKHAPRPFILYVTKKKDAFVWHKILTEEIGYKRVGRFDGDTSGSSRKDIIKNWIENKLDGIVATSAFGVGIDKSDIRTIIHATIPETLDRYYQEVGRGGRDGRASNSLMVFENSDWSLSKRMANPKIISDELGIAKWRAMFESRKKYAPQSEDIFRINPEAVRQGRTGSNDEDVRWNMRTLSLMARAGFLELNIEASSLTNEDIDEEESTSIIAAMSTIQVHLLRYDHLLPEKWETDISASRKKTLNGGIRNLRLMQDMLEKSKEVSEVLSELYSNNSEMWPVSVTKVCGGCPADRFKSNQNKTYHVPIATPIYNISSIDISKWSLMFPYLDPKNTHVFYDPDSNVKLIKLLQWLVRDVGVQELCADEESLITKLPEWHALYKHSKSKILIHRGFRGLDEEPYSPLARVTLFDTNATSEDINCVALINRPMHLIFYPTQTPDPDQKTRLLSDILDNTITLQQLFTVINQ